MADWDAIKKEYVNGISQSELAEKYGVSLSSVKHKCAAEKWTALKHRACTVKEKKMVQSAAMKQVKKESSIQHSADGLVTMIEHYTDSGEILSADEIAKLTRALKDLKEIKHDLTEYELREQNLRITALEKAAEENKADTEMTVKFVNMEWDHGNT